jgi:hypothetical protein
MADATTATHPKLPVPSWRPSCDLPAIVDAALIPRRIEDALLAQSARRRLEATKLRGGLGRPWRQAERAVAQHCPAIWCNPLTCAARSVLAIRYQRRLDITTLSRRVLTRDAVVFLSLLLGVEGPSDADTAAVNWRRSQSGGVGPTYPRS